MNITVNHGGLVTLCCGVWHSLCPLGERCLPWWGQLHAKGDRGQCMDCFRAVREHLAGKLSVWCNLQWNAINVNQGPSFSLKTMTARCHNRLLRESDVWGRPGCAGQPPRHHSHALKWTSLKSTDTHWRIVSESPCPCPAARLKRRSMNQVAVFSIPAQWSRR